MELDGKDVVLPDTGDISVAVFGFGGRNRRVFRNGIVAVDKIDEAAGLDPFIQRTFRIQYLDLVPADLRDLDAGAVCETLDLTFEDTQPGSLAVEFLAALEKCLITNADAQERLAGADRFQNGRFQLLAAHGGEAVIKSADTRQDDRLGLGKLLRRRN